MTDTQNQSAHRKSIPIWLMLAVCAASLPLCAWSYLLYVRSSGLADYQQNLQTQADYGHPTTRKELIDAFPEIDADRQYRLLRALERIGNWPDSIYFSINNVHSSASISETHWLGFSQSQHRKDVEAVIAIYNEGPCYLSAIAWAKLEPNSIFPTGHRLLGAEIYLIEWVCIDILRHPENSDTYSTFLDQMDQQEQNNGSIFDLMIDTSTNRTLHDTQLYQMWAIHKKPPRSLHHRNALKLWAQCFMYDFILSKDGEIYSMEIGPLPTYDSSEGFSKGILQLIYSKYWFYHNMNSLLAASYTYMSYLDKRTTTFHVNDLIRPTDNEYTAYLDECMYTLLDLDANERMHQACILLLEHYQKHHTLPADSSELRIILGAEAYLLNHSNDHIGLTYERLDAGRFRFGLDNTHPAPYGMPASLIKSILGMPATQEKPRGKIKRSKIPSASVTALYNFVIRKHYIEINAAWTKIPLTELLTVEAPIPTSKKRRKRSATASSTNPSAATHIKKDTMPLSPQTTQTTPSSQSSQSSSTD